ncbi:MAG: helix-turn-helix transcriptional regulator [Actinomycetota bacterium]|nr:helix-turn-helix transcriptional regulator [Actinomycetota bacterium]
MSQEELAKASGVSPATVVQIELGNRQPQGRTLRKLAAALDVEVADLIEEEEAEALKAAPPRDRPVESGTGVPSFGELWLLAERRLLEERRLLSSLNPFVTQVEARTAYWIKLAESGQVSQHRLEDATQDLGITARSFKDLVDAAVAEGWIPTERQLLVRVYQDVAGPYRQAWRALLETWITSAADTKGLGRLQLVEKADEAVRMFEEAEEALSAA